VTRELVRICGDPVLKQIGVCEAIDGVARFVAPHDVHVAAVQRDGYPRSWLDPGIDMRKGDTLTVRFEDPLVTQYGIDEGTATLD